MTGVILRKGDLDTETQKDDRVKKQRDTAIRKRRAASGESNPAHTSI